MEWVAPEVIRRTEQVIHQRLGTASPGRQDHRGGAKELAGILNKMGKENEGDVLLGLSEHHPELAAEVRALMFVFVLGGMHGGGLDHDLPSVRSLKHHRSA